MMMGRISQIIDKDAGYFTSARVRVTVSRSQRQLYTLSKFMMYPRYFTLAQTCFFSPEAKSSFSHSFQIHDVPLLLHVCTDLFIFPRS